MTISELFYGTISGGPFSGALAVHIGFSHDGISMEPPALIERILRWPQGAAKIIELHGDFTSTPDEELLAFCKAVKDWNYQILVLTNGQVWPSWFTLASWITVVISTEPWLMYRCHEIRFLLSEPNTPEPTLPENESAETRLYVVPTNKLPISSVFTFIKKAKRRWSVLIEPSRYPQENMLPKEKKEEKP